MEVVAFVSQLLDECVPLARIRAGLYPQYFFLRTVLGFPMADKIALGTVAESTYRPFVVSSLLAAVGGRTHDYSYKQ
jgi:hypothetical protein